MGNQNLFGNKKKWRLKNKMFYVFLVGVLAFGWWINQPSNLNIDDELVTNAQIPTKEKNTANSDEAATGEKNKNVVSSETSAYYLLKAIDDEITLYYYDENGHEELLRVTDIPFSLMSVNDQREFEKGIIVDTEESLNQLLEDFES